MCLCMCERKYKYFYVNWLVGQCQNALYQNQPTPKIIEIFLREMINKT